MEGWPWPWRAWRALAGKRRRQAWPVRARERSRAAWRGVAARGEIEHVSLARGMRAGRAWPSARGVRPARTTQQSSFERGGSWPMAMPCPVPNREMGWARMEGWMTSGPWLMVF